MKSLCEQLSYPISLSYVLTETLRIVRRIDRKVNEWAALSRLKSFLQQREIKDGIDRLHRDMDAAMMKFNVLKFCSPFIYKAHVLDAQIRINMELTRGHQESRAVQERDKAEIRDVLQKIVKSTDDMRALLNMQSAQPIDEIMESLQTVCLHYVNLGQISKPVPGTPQSKSPT